MPEAPAFVEEAPAPSPAEASESSNNSSSGSDADEGGDADQEDVDEESDVEDVEEIEDVVLPENQSNEEENATESEPEQDQNLHGRDNGNSVPQRGQLCHGTRQIAGMNDLHDRLFACINNSSEGDSASQSVTANVAQIQQGTFLLMYSFSFSRI
jgi:hypothetical protein